MPVVTLTAEERIGTLLAEKYELLEILGEGGMGVVYEATHKWTGRRVAVKLVHPTIATKPEVARRFLQEARTAAALEHPNVVQVLDMGSSDDGTIYLVLELLSGEPLARSLDRGRMSLEEMLDTLLPVMNALASAHDKSILHRDLKPENIFLAYQGGEVVPKVLDFGLAKVVQDDPSVSSATNTGIVIGTPHYLAPEQAKAEKVIGPPVDVWAMGVVVYECLTGSLPFQGDSATAIIVNVCTVDPIPLDKLNPAIPPAVIAAIGRALAKNPADRYPNMRAFAGALVLAAQNAGARVSPPKGLLDGDAQRWLIAPEPASAPSAPIARSAPTPSRFDRDRPASRKPLFFALAAGALILCAATVGVTLYAIDDDVEQPVPEATAPVVEPDPAPEPAAPVVAPAVAPAAPTVIEPSAPVAEPTAVEPARPRPRRTVRRHTTVEAPQAPTPPNRRTSLSDEF